MTPSSRTLTDFAYFDMMHELAGVRRHLERVPDDKLDWRPHDKSKTLGELATHLAQIPFLPIVVATQPELDFAARPPQPKSLPSRDAILATFDETVAALTTAMADVDDAVLDEAWTLRAGPHVVLSQSKGRMLRTLGVSHIIHHRAQLGVYLRLLDIPVPAVYGPSADE